MTTAHATETAGLDVRTGAIDSTARVELSADFGQQACLRCPRCKANLQGLECPFCGLVMRLNRGIIHALPPDRAAYFARFIADYEHIRKAEGRGSASDEFYLNLPFKDISGANHDHWKIRARTFAHLVNHIFSQSVMVGQRVLDLGAGNCWLSYRLALAGFRPFAVDLLTNDYDGLGAATRFENKLPGLFPRFQAELACLPFQDDQFDCAVFNASFHYAEDYARALGEAVRCVKAGGLIVIADTPWYSNDESGQAMLSERRAAFLRQYGTASDSVRCLEYLTDHRLQSLADQLSIDWRILRPNYGWRWAMRPLVAKLRGRREPSRFRIYVARKP